MEIRNNSKIAFSSNYKIPISYKSSDDASVVFSLKEKGIEIHKQYLPSNQINRNAEYNMFIKADDKFDDKVESLLLSNGIKFEKKKFDELLKKNEILERIKIPQEDLMYSERKLVGLNTAKIEKLFQKNPFYLNKTEYGWKERENGFIEFLKTGLDIKPSLLDIREENDIPHIDFIDGRHRFSYLRDLGFKKIPMAIDEKSYNLAVKYNLIEV